jgi:hypothetical protein
MLEDLVERRFFRTVQEAGALLSSIPATRFATSVSMSVGLVAMSVGGSRRCSG